MMSINSVIRLIIAIIIIIIKSVIGNEQIDITIIPLTSVILVFAACEIFEINVDTYRLISLDFNWVLARAYKERFVIFEVHFWALVCYHVRFEGYFLAVVWNFVT